MYQRRQRRRTRFGDVVGDMKPDGLSDAGHVYLQSDLRHQRKYVGIYNDGVCMCLELGDY